MPRRDAARGISIVPMGSFDDDPGIRPQSHIFVGSRAPWDAITDALPQHDAHPPPPPALLSFRALPTSTDGGLPPATAEDEAFLFRLYASTRADEVASFGWAPPQVDMFLRMQFLAQRRAYELGHPGSEHRLVLREGVPVGRIWVARSAQAILLLDVALLQEHRGAGIGETLLRALLAEATERRVPVQLHVDVTNRARRLYERLGFRWVSGDGMRDAMEWSPG